MPVHKVNVDTLSEAERYLMELDFAWPGNVRHVEQLAARLSLFSPEEPVTPHDLGELLETDEVDSGFEDRSAMPSESEIEDGLPAFLARAERQWLEEAMRRYAGLNKKELARKLNIGESTLHKKIKLYGIDS